MDFTHEGLIRIEDKPGEGEVLGQAIGLGQALIDTFEERGYSLDELSEVEMKQLLVSFFFAEPSTEGLRTMMNKFREASIDPSPRVLTLDEGGALYFGLGLIDSLSDASLAFRRFMSGEGGHNGRSVFLDRNLGRIAHRYNVQLERAVSSGVIGVE